MDVCIYIYIYMYQGSVAILAQGCDLATTLCRGLGVPACHYNVAVLSQARLVHLSDVME